MKSLNVLLVSLMVSMFAMPAFAGQMFENAERRGPDQTEGKGILHLDFASPQGHMSCTAFFVKNKNNKPYIMTARHCAHFEMAKACNEGRISFITQAGKFEGHCLSAVLETNDLDETLLLGDFRNWDEVLSKIEFYRLSEQRPRFETKLKMMGYPVDPVRQGSFTVTDKCWVSANRMVSLNDYPAQDQTSNRAYMAAQPPNPLAALIRLRMVAFNNCSVYGGNSGGPILKENTNIVLGLPTSYYPDAVKIQPADLSTSMDATADFIKKHRAALTSMGVEFAQPYADGEYRAPYEMRFDSNYKSACYRSTESSFMSAPVDPSWCHLADE